MARTCCFAHLFFFFFLQQTFTEHLPTPRTTLIPGEAKMTEVVFYRTSAVRPGTIRGPGRALVASTRLCRRGSGVAPGGPGGSGRRRRWWWGGTWCWRWHCPVWGRCHRCGCRGSWRRPRWFGWGEGAVLALVLELLLEMPGVAAGIRVLTGRMSLVWLPLSAPPLSK